MYPTPSSAGSRLGTHLASRLVALALCLTAISCGDESDPVIDSAPQPFELALTLSLPQVAGVSPTSVRTLVHTLTGDLALDTVVSLTTASGAGDRGAMATTLTSLSGVASNIQQSQATAATQVEMTFTVLLPGSLQGETIIVSLDVLDQDGTVVYSSYDQALESVGSATTAALLEMFYTGPGASAAALTLAASESPAAPGERIDVTAVIRDASGNELLNVPLSWTLAGTGLTLESIEVAEGRNIAHVRAGADDGSGALLAILPNDLQSAIDLQVVVPRGTVALQVAAPALPGVTLPSLHLQLRRAGGQTVIDTLIPMEGAGPWSLDPDVEVRLESADEQFLAEAEVVDGEGTAWLATVAPVIASADGVTTEVPLGFVGPGGGVARISLQVASSPAEPGSLVTVTAILRDGDGSEIQDVPVSWAVSDPSMSVEDVSVVDGRSVASIRVGDVPGTAAVSATVPSLLQASTLVVVEARRRALVLTFQIPSFPGISLNALDIGIQAMDGSSVANQRFDLPMSGSIDVELPADAPGSRFQVTARALNAAGTAFYSTDGPTSVSEGMPSMVSLGRYVGPGTDAATVTVEVSGTPEGDGDLVTATAVIKDSQGTELTDVPVSWSVTAGELSIQDVSTADGRSEARVRVGSSSGTIRAEIPTGRAGVATIEVNTGPTVLWKSITKSYPTIPGVDLAVLVLKVWRGDGTVALDTVAPFSTTLIPLLADSATEPFTIEAAAYDSDERLWLDMNAPIDMAPSFYPTELSFDYAGPGLDAETVSVTPRTETIQAGSRLVLEARAYDGSGTYISGVPLRWTTGAGLQIDSVWLDPTARFSKAAVTALAEGTVQVTATTVSGVEGTASVTVEGLPPLDTTIDFEYYPDGTRTCVKCSISDEFSSVGVTFRFYGAFASGGAGYPTTVRDADGNTRLTNDYQRFAYGGYLTGIIKMTFAQAIPQASFTMLAPGISTDTFIVYDTQGQIIDDAVIDVQTTSQAGAWVTAVVTISSSRGIGVIDAKATGSIVYIDDLVF